MLKNHIKGLLIGASFVTLLSGCSSPKDPFQTRLERPDEQCLTDGSHVMDINPQQAFGDRKVMRYVVKKGDTLWDISKHFLVYPWYWKKLWYDNPQIRNPHLIYPGDVLAVVSLNGERRITITEGNGMYHGVNTGRVTKDGRAIYKYTPANGTRVHNYADDPITFANRSIAPFLSHAEVFTPAQIQGLPTVFGDAGDYLTLTQQQTIYTQRPATKGQEFSIYRIGSALADYSAGNAKPTVLGYQMDYIGKAGVIGEDIKTGATKLKPTETKRAVLEGDVLVPVDAHKDVDYFPKLPSGQCSRGYILTNTNAHTTMIKEFDTVVTSFGRDNDAQVGDIWKIERPGPVRTIDGKQVQIPAKELGFLMIIKVYDHYSLGFVVDSTQNIDLTDWLVRP